MHKLNILALTLLAFSGCDSHPQEGYCDSDNDCRNEPETFCDINGEYPESGRIAHSCSVQPENCPVARCHCIEGTKRCLAGELLTCDPGGSSETPLSCPNGCASISKADAACQCDVGSTRCDDEGNDVLTCASDGLHEDTTTCDLGCNASADPIRCHTFTPSFGVGQALSQFTPTADVVIPAGSTFDGVLLKNAQFQTIAVDSIVVNQAGGGPQIRVFVAKSFTINGLVNGSPTTAIAFIAPGTITVNGVMDFGHVATVSGSCVGADVSGAGTGFANGAGAGGHMTAGGAGGGMTPHVAGGVAITPLDKLNFGCQGGRTISTNPIGYGGVGGGAVQLVSLTNVVFADGGIISVGGGGGMGPGTGGGSGGTVVIEAPQVSFAATSGVAANGGAGGSCTPGENGRMDAMFATSNKCQVGTEVDGVTPRFTGGGNGGTGSMPAGDGRACTTNCASVRYGGGGGAVGRLEIRTRDGNVDRTPGSFLSAQVIQTMLTLE